MAYAEAGWECIVYTSRPQSHTQEIWNWLGEHDLARFVYDVQTGKPSANWYVDDRAVSPELFEEWIEGHGLHKPKLEEHDAAENPISMTPAGDPRFHALLRQIGELHDRKQQDYGRDEDPFANVRGAAEWGLEPWVGALVRATDKMKRLQKLARGGQLTNETAEDSFMDLAVYALIGLILYREKQ